MKSFMTTSAAAITLLASSTALAANLSIPMAFEYLALDGKEINTNMFTHKSDLELTQGTHKIAIRYHDMVEDDFSDAQTFYKSAPFIVTLEVDGDYEYQLRTPSGDYAKNPKSYVKKPQVIIKRSDKGNVNYSVQLTDLKEDSFVANLFNGGKNDNFDELSVQATSSSAAKAQAAMKPAPKAVTPVAAATVVTTATVAPAKEVAPAQTGSQAEQMLQYWWLQADEETRKEFMSWAIKQL
ncbi:DUF2057 domain-containing protein [Shewanella sp. WXL01]|uniref:DUF2057 domain-containing protein n=1 Tax=Shewanella sp. WXL01 TaxID=2709721 RepID=UPI0014385EC3|nr:DUF2057 domain-containing protein [Shewanella sp. WXL01]NKF51810.1 DUF2057 domain-containing protein [Shewanella sp. WXL01]